jgi:serine protease Do
MSEFKGDDHENDIEVFASDIADQSENDNQDRTGNGQNSGENVQQPAGGNPENGSVNPGYGQAGDQNGAYGNGYYGPANGAQNGQNGQNQGEYNPYGGNVQYKWNYDDYQKALNDKNKPPHKKNKGLKAFIICVSSVVAVALISLAGVGIAAIVKNGDISPGGSTTGGTSSDQVLNPNGPTLKTTDKPAATASSSTDTGTLPLQMSSQQVFNKVKNSVVTVQIYDTSSVDPAAEGSGIIMSDTGTDGYIITNEHVIDGANSIEVVLANNKQYGATVVGKDLRTDLAVLKVKASGLTSASFGNSDQINVAESVLAIGNPGGLGGSVTEGIISALNRSITTENNYTENCIQTDAPINPGNSGGALVNMYGQVIGITSSKIEATGYEGMGFAIPINTAQPVINDIIKYGYVTGRVKIGISVTEYDAYRGAALGYPAGLLIQAVDSTSDAAAKGIKANDVITKINGTAISTYDQFYQIESKYKPGNTVKLTIYRHDTNSTFDVSIKLLEDKGDTAPATSQNSQDSQAGSAYSDGSSLSPFGN